VDWAVVAACVTGGLLLLAVIALAVVASRHLRLSTEQKGLRDQLGRTEADRQRAAAALERLKPYEAILDAEAHAVAVRTQAETSAVQTTEQARQQAARITAEAHAIHSTAQAAAARLTASTQSAADRILAESQASAQATRTQASTDATRIVNEATRRAEEIAGSALEAVREAKRLEQTAQAMKNVIEGYGDRYLMPTQGLLDELADEFGFAEAGKRLKAARARSRDMISDAMAATCDYAEASRRATAIAFVLDAFNGKVDTILADVRHDNFGTLQQKIRDAFQLVNQNGRAFRDARILPEYLDARSTSCAGPWSPRSSR
jgi:cell division septum initiation protein DivIVA